MGRNLSVNTYFQQLATGHTPQHRFAGTTKDDWTAWRKALLTAHNILMVAERGTGYVAADGQTRVKWSVAKHKTAARALGKAITVAGSTSPEGLDDKSLAARDHLISTASAMFAARKLEARKEAAKLAARSTSHPQS